MSKIASGSNLILKRVREEDFGEIAPVPEIERQAFTTYTPSFTKAELNNPTITGDRQDASVEYGNKMLAFTLESVLIHTAHDDLIESAMMSPWVDYPAVPDPTLGEGQRIEIGSPAVLFTHTFEADQTDINTQRRFTGLMTNGFTLTSPIEGNIDISFDMVGKEEEKVDTPLGDAGDLVEDSPYTNLNGTIVLGGVDQSSVCIVQSLDLTITNNAEASFCWGLDSAKSVTEARAEVTGNLTLFYIDSVVTDLWLDDNQSSLEFEVFDKDGHSYHFNMPSITPTGAENPFAEGERVITLPFRATTGNGAHNALTITRYDVQPIPAPLQNDLLPELDNGNE